MNARPTPEQLLNAEFTETEQHLYAPVVGTVGRSFFGTAEAADEADGTYGGPVASYPKPSDVEPEDLPEGPDSAAWDAGYEATHASCACCQQFSAAHNALAPCSRCGHSNLRPELGR